MLVSEDTDFIITVPDVSHRKNVEFQSGRNLQIFSGKKIFYLKF